MKPSKKVAFKPEALYPNLPGAPGPSLRAPQLAVTPLQKPRLPFCNACGLIMPGRLRCSDCSRRTSEFTLESLQ